MPRCIRSTRKGDEMGMDHTYQLRLAGAQDAEEVLAVYAPYVLNSAATFETRVPTREQFCERMETIMKQFPWIVCTHEGRIVAYAHAAPHREKAAYRWNAEVSVYVEEAHCGRGLAGALYRALSELLAMQGYYTLCACITLPGEKSVALHRAFGFKKTGAMENAGFKLGKWHDVIWMARSLREYDAPGSVPIELGAFETERVRRILLNNSH